LLNVIVSAITIVSTMIYLQVQILAGFLVLSVSTEGIISLHMSGIIFFSILVIYIWAEDFGRCSHGYFYGILIIIAIISSGIFLIHEAGGVKHTFDLLIQSDPANVSIIGGDAEKRTGMWLAYLLLFR
jgi:SSS family solute:Na+ symporter